MLPSRLSGFQGEDVPTHRWSDYPDPVWSPRPISTFDADLRRYDPDLFLAWFEPACRWQIWRKSPRSRDHPCKCVMTIQGWKAEFKEPDSADIDAVHRLYNSAEGQTFKEYVKQSRKNILEAQDEWNAASSSERRYYALDVCRTLERTYSRYLPQKKQRIAHAPRSCDRQGVRHA